MKNKRKRNYSARSTSKI